MRSLLPRIVPAIITCVVLSLSIANAQDDPEKIVIRTTPLGQGIFMLDGQGGFGGGNVTAAVGEDGILLSDNMYVAMMPKVYAALKTLSEKPIRYAINSHFHRDHIAGNATFGPGTTIIAHENVRKRLMAANTVVTPTTALLPTLTFKEQASLYFNGEEVQLIHFPNGHTDSDVVVYFTQSRVLHMGDMFFFGMFPAIYAQGGGNIRQLIINLETLLTRIAPDTKVVPGHGDLATVSDLRNYLEMLKETTRIVEDAIGHEKSLDQLLTEKALSRYDKLGSGGAQTTDQYLTMLFGLLSGGK